jgi:serine phosphatase RsbU (regulator of sigma subunit)/FixJ family two-component response regulator
MKLYIICVDDERLVLDALQAQLISNFGDEYNYEIADNGDEAIEIIKEIREGGGEIGLIVSDQLMPGMKGNELLKWVHEYSPNTKKILLTGQASMESVVDALNEADLYRYISKPWDTMDLVMSIRSALEVYYDKKWIDEEKRNLEYLYEVNKKLSKIRDIDNLIDELSSIIINKIDITKLVIKFCKNYYIYNNGIREIEGDCSEEIIDEISKNNIINVGNCNHNPYGNMDYVKKNNIKSLWGIKEEVNKKLGKIYIYFWNNNKYNLYNEYINNFMELLMVQIIIKIESIKLYEYFKIKVKSLYEKNKDFEDSIIYASRLQKTILQPLDDFNNFFRDSRIYLSPKNIVSGDFYWYKIIDEKIYFCLADCTGHGVPGALLSILGMNILNDIEFDNNTLPSKILKELNKGIKEKLNKNLDGMDIIMCIYDKRSKKLIYSSGGRGLILVKDDIYEIKGDKNGVGGFTSIEYEYKDEVIYLSYGNKIFLYSDGYIDQFGGEMNKKLGITRMKEKIMDIKDCSISDIIDGLVVYLGEWRGSNEQTDDISIIGFGVID